MKLLFRFLLLLSLAVLGQYGYQQLNTSGGPAVLTMSAAHHGSPDENARLKATEVDEDKESKQVACKKYSLPGKYLVNLFSNTASQYFSSDGIHPSPYVKCFFYSYPHKYIVYRVIRI